MILIRNLFSAETWSGLTGVPTRGHLPKVLYLSLSSSTNRHQLKATRSKSFSYLEETASCWLADVP